MALKNSKGRKDILNSGYYRVFAELDKDPIALQLANLISKVQACVITKGSELDGKYLISSTYNPNNVILKKTSAEEDIPNGHYSKFKISKKQWAQVSGKQAMELDYVVITEDTVDIYEVKDGDNFDTKKSKSEIDGLVIAQEYFEDRFPEKDVKFYVVLWNAKDIKLTSFKVSGLEEGILITGKEFCEKTGCKFNEINEARKEHCQENKEWLLDQIQEIINNCNANNN